MSNEVRGPSGAGDGGAVQWLGAVCACGFGFNIYGQSVSGACAMSKRLMTVLDDEAAHLLLALTGSPRKQGEFLSGLVRAEAERRRAARLPAEVDALRQSVTALEQRVAALEGIAQQRLAHIPNGLLTRR